MRHAINQATTMHTTDLAAEVRAYAAAGCRGIELWLPKIESWLAGRPGRVAAALLRDHGLAVVGACYQGGLLGAEGPSRAAVLADYQRTLDRCSELGVPVLVVPDFGPALGAAPEALSDSADAGAWLARAAERLVEAAERARPHGVRLAVEFLAGSAQLRSLATASRLVALAEHPHVGLVLDVHHFMLGPSKEADLAALDIARLLLVHVCDGPDLPREAITDAHRLIVGQGVWPVGAIVRRLRQRGYTGWLSFEAFNPAYGQGAVAEIAPQVMAGMRQLG